MTDASASSLAAFKRAFQSPFRRTYTLEERTFTDWLKLLEHADQRISRAARKPDQGCR